MTALLLILLAAAPVRKLTTLERVQVSNLERVRADRERLARERRTMPAPQGYRDIRAVLHCHAEDAAHTAGTRPEVLAAAKKAGVSAGLLSDHVRPERDYINDSWRGLREGVLFIPGSEAEGFLNYPVRSIRGLTWGSREEYISLILRGGGLIFLSHVEERLDHSMDRLNGLEIYNRHTDANDETEYRQWFRKALSDPAAWADISGKLERYHEEYFGAQQDYLAPILAAWDRATQTHRLTGIAANDAHHNQVFTLTKRDGRTAVIDSFERKNLGTVELPEALLDRPDGEVLNRLDFDPYEVSFRNVSTHLWVKSLTEPEVREALRAGRAYVAHDWLCDPTGFRFETAAGNRLTAASPVRAHFRLLRGGEPALEQFTDSLDWKISSPGVYRLELWLEVGGEQRPWIYSNPIYATQ